MPRTTLLVDRRRLLDRIRRTNASIVVLHAPAGYGKTYVAQRIARGDAVHALRDPSAGPLDAIALESMVASLSGQAGEDGFTILLDDADALLGGRTAAKDLEKVFASLEPPGRIVLCSQNGSAASLAASLPPHTVEYLDRSALRFDDAELRQAFSNDAIDDATFLRLASLTQGWPAAALFFARVWPELTADERMQPLRSTALTPLAQFIAAKVLDDLDAHAIDVTESTVATGDTFDDDGTLTQRYQIAVRDANGKLAVHPLVAWALRTTRPGNIRARLEAAVADALAAGDAARALRLEIQLGIEPTAEEALSPFDAVNVPPPVHEEVLERFRTVSRTGHMRAWYALFPARRFAVSAAVLADESTSVFAACSDDEWREALAATAALAHAEAGETAAARSLLDDIDGPHCAIARATLATMNGKFAHAAELLRGVPIVLAPVWHARRVMLEAERARAQGQWELEHERTEDLIAQMSHATAPLLIAALASAMYGAWLAGDEESYRRTHARFEAEFAQTPVLAFANLAIAASGRTKLGPDVPPLWNARASIVAAAAAHDAGVSVELARQAIESADRSGDVMTRILARVALAEKHPASRRRFLREALDLAAQCEAAAYTESLRALLDTGDVRGTLAPLVARLRAVSAQPDVDERAPLEFRLASGQVRRGENEVPISAGGLGLLVALAVDVRPVSNETLCDRLWPDTPYEQAYKTLKMCVYRTRAQLGDATAIETSGRGGYKLADHVAVDVRFLPRILEAIARKQVPAHIENRLGRIFDQLTLGRPPWFADWPWFATTEALLERATLEIGTHYGNRLLAQGDAVAALAAAQRLIAVDPLSEGAREVAIRAHIAADDRSSALSEFRRYQQLLGEELGVEPSPSLRRYIEL